MVIKVVLAEDNSFFREQIIKKLSLIDGLEIIYAAKDGEDFLNALRRIKPEVAITDIDMPKMTGMEVAKIIRKELPDIELIFITSYNEYIREAINLYALDYIEKPINIDRFYETIDRIKKRFAVKEKIFQFKFNKEILYLNAKDIYFVEAFGKKSRIYTEFYESIINHSFHEVEKILDDKHFFKTSRSYIVNMKKIQSIKRISRTSFEITFKDKNYTAYLSKNHIHDFRSKFMDIYDSEGDIYG